MTSFSAGIYLRESESKSTDPQFGLRSGPSISQGVMCACSPVSINAHLQVFLAL